MPALDDLKLERFAQALLRNIATGLARGKAATAAAIEAGYRGSAMADNARKRANRKDVKARMVELAAPAQAEMERILTVDVERAKQRLANIIMADVDLAKTKAPDVIAAIRQLAAIEGWNAPTNVNLHKHDSTDWSTDELVAFLAHAEARLGGGEEADRGTEESDQVH